MKLKIYKVKGLSKRQQSRLVWSGDYDTLDNFVRYMGKVLFSFNKHKLVLESGEEYEIRVEEFYIDLCEWDKRLETPSSLKEFTKLNPDWRKR